MNVVNDVSHRGGGVLRWLGFFLPCGWGCSTRTTPMCGTRRLWVGWWRGWVYSLHRCPHRSSVARQSPSSPVCAHSHVLKERYKGEGKKPTKQISSSLVISSSSFNIFFFSLPLFLSESIFSIAKRNTKQSFSTVSGTCLEEDLCNNNSFADI